MATDAKRLAIRLVLAAAVAARSAAAAEPAPPTSQASVLLKALEFDRSQENGLGEFVIAVAWNASNKSSESWAFDMQKAFERMKTFRQRPLRVVLLEASRGGFRKGLEDAKARVVYLAPGTDSFAADVCSAAKEALVGTLGGSLELAKACVAVSVVLEGRKPRLIVNLARSKEQGMDLGASLLRFAEVIR